MTIIIEKFLAAGGHNRTQIEAIERLSPGQTLTVITSRVGCQARSLGHSRIVPVLATQRERKTKTAWAIENDATLIQSLFQEYQLNEAVPVIIPSAELHDLRVVLKLIQNNPGIALFKMRLLNEIVITKLSDIELHTLRTHVSAGTISLLTETESLSKRLKVQFDLESKSNFLLPCLIFPEDDVLIPIGNDGRATFRVGYLGGLRKEKGSAQIPAIIRELFRFIADNGHDINVDFIMQGNRTSWYRLKNIAYDLKLKYSVSGIFRRNRGKIRIIKSRPFMSDAEFVRTILSVDVLILPYDIKSYQFRGSGIIIDGVLALKPIIYTKGIGMSNYLEYGNGEAASSAKEFAESIVNVLLKFPEYKSKAASARAALLLELQRTANYLAQ
ncbi:MAG: hypothetical protein ACLP7P_06745 [Rhodomicrobium sp.]